MSVPRHFTFSVLLRLALVGALGLGLAMVTAALPERAAAIPSEVSASNSFVVPLSTGYGIDECLAIPGECGLEAAASLCRSRGYGATVGYVALREGEAVEVSCDS